MYLLLKIKLFVVTRIEVTLLTHLIHSESELSHSTTLEALDHYYCGLFVQHNVLV